MEKFKRKPKPGMIFIGIDPGKTGAIAAIDVNQEIILLKDCPEGEFDMVWIVRSILDRDKMLDSENLLTIHAKYVRGAIERAQSMPKQGVKSMFTYGTNYGIWRGALASFGIPFLLPTPQQWQRGVVSKAEDKKPALAAARRMFPKAELVGPRGGGKHGRADALLIADWCRRQY